MPKRPLWDDLPGRHAPQVQDDEASAAPTAGDRPSVGGPRNAALAVIADAAGVSEETTTVAVGVDNGQPAPPEEGDP
jgi:hypothetical protein